MHSFQSIKTRVYTAQVISHGRSLTPKLNYDLHVAKEIWDVLTRDSLDNDPTNFPSTEANSCTANHKVPCLLWNPKFPYCLRHSMPTDSKSTHHPHFAPSAPKYRAHFSWLVKSIKSEDLWHFSILWNFILVSRSLPYHQGTTRRTTTSGCAQLLAQYIPIYPSYVETVLHPQPKDRPCHGEMELTKHGIP